MVYRKWRQPWYEMGVNLHHLRGHRIDGEGAVGLNFQVKNLY